MGGEGKADIMWQGIYLGGPYASKQVQMSANDARYCMTGISRYSQQNGPEGGFTKLMIDGDWEGKTGHYAIEFLPNAKRFIYTWVTK